MKLIITTEIYTTEFLPHAQTFNLDVLKSSARKALLGLGNMVSTSRRMPGTVLKKMSLISSGGAGRVLFLLQVGKGVAVLVMVRQKNDKQIGQNMAIVNPRFKKLLEKNMDKILKELEAGRFREWLI